MNSITRHLEAVSDYAGIVQYSLDQQCLWYMGIKVTVDVSDSEPSFSITTDYQKEFNFSTEIDDFQQAIDYAHDLSVALRFYLQQENFESPFNHGAYWAWFHFDNHRRLPHFANALESQIKAWFSDKCDSEHRAMTASRDYGFVYIIKSETNPPQYKIGRSKDPVSRIGKLEVKLPFDIEVLHLIETDSASSLEGYYHELYSDKRVRGEWFELDDQAIEELKQHEVRNHHLSVDKKDGKWVSYV